MRDKSVYSSIMAGLNEALEDAKSNAPILERNTVTIDSQISNASNALDDEEEIRA